MTGTGQSRCRAVLAAAAALLASCLAQLVLVATPAHACSCAAPPDDPAHLQRADVVFVGTLLERRPPAGGDVRSTGEAATYVFDVSRVHKGEAGARQEVLTADSGASCGLEISGSGPFLVYAQRGGDGIVQAPEDGLVATLCGGTRPVATTAPGALEERLGPGRAPQGPGAAGGSADSPSGPSASLLTGAAATLAASVALGLLLLRRSAPPPSSSS